MMRFFSVSEGAIQSLLTWNFVGILPSRSLLWPPIRCVWSQKTPSSRSFSVLHREAYLTLFGTNLDQMLWGRILPRGRKGDVFTLGTAILFDVFQKEKAINAINSLNMIIPIIMATAPLLGGYLNYNFGFRSNFVAILLFVLVSLVICLALFKETLPKEKWAPFQLNKIGRDFKQAFGHLGFWQVTIITSLLFAAYITFVAATSVLFIIEFGVSKALFPFFQVAILGSWVAGSLLLKSRLAQWGTFKVKKMGIFCCAFGWGFIGNYGPSRSR